ncbi:MAG: ABC-F family ATP-binding cassette domain-containing protein, partial [Bacteroidaceae bacterium]|nr:ABC-F family ATP-binding cassette domain-containing protein [Bacteroidaceae bacterium]
MVSYLQVQNLTRHVGDRTLFSNLSFGIGQGHKVGLIARNGTGKTTLLNILAGTDQADGGNVVYHNGIRVGYLPQQPIYPQELTVIEACFWHGNDTTNLIREYEQCMATEGHPGLEVILD